jgi:hypothetical protein
VWKILPVEQADSTSLLPSKLISKQVFKIRKGEKQQDFEDEIVIGMNGAVAGSRGVNRFHHGRFGDGITLMADMAPRATSSQQMTRKGCISSSSTVEAMVKASLPPGVSVSTSSL